MKRLTFEELLEWAISKGKEEGLIAEIDFLKEEIKVKFSPRDTYRDGIIAYNILESAKDIMDNRVH